MGNEEVFYPLRENFQIEEHGYGDSALTSNSLLQDQIELLDAHDLTDDMEKAEDKEWTVGSCYLICLTIGTGG